MVTCNVKKMIMTCWCGAIIAAFTEKEWQFGSIKADVLEKMLETVVSHLRSSRRNDE